MKTNICYTTHHNCNGPVCSVIKKPRLTRDQKRALDAYNYALRQEDRYLGSVFVTTMGQRAIEEKTRIAYDACKRLGMTHEHGL